MGRQDEWTNVLADPDERRRPSHMPANTNMAELAIMYVMFLVGALIIFLMIVKQFAWFLSMGAAN